MSRFADVDFATLPVRNLAIGSSPPSHEGFRPVRPEFSTYWKKGRVFRECGANIAACWYLEVEGKLGCPATPR
ncbi:hypothetical protein OpiT1DRAFT_04351 [Opitutaceae bacterium TAV1]|nr:hypothetical protein OpiT1DRAFT_04351 [Opitutaceae bacterium TAV1]